MRRVSRAAEAPVRHIDGVTERSGLDARPRATPAGPRLGRIHDRVLHVLAEVDAGAPADRALSAAFRRARDLGSHDRAHVRDEVYGLLRHRRRARDLVERGCRALRKDPSLFEAPMRQRLELLAHLAAEGATLSELEARDRYAARRVPRLFERIVQGKLPPPKHGAERAAAIETSLPDWLFRQLVQDLGLEEARALGLALLERAPVTLRVDPRRMGRDDLLTRLAEAGIEARPTDRAPDGLILAERADLRDWPELSDGRAELQDEGSQLIALAVGAEPGDAVLDACAGAGGKTLALWSAMGGEGHLVAVEPDKKKRDALRARLDASGAHGVEVLEGELEALPEALRGRFDRVLVDAPCTGSGTFRRHPDLKWRLGEEDLRREVSRQSRLLGAAVAALAPGGRLVYATCSVLRAENEAAVERLAASAPELTPESLALGWGPELAQALGATGATARIGPGPGPQGPDGFFIARLRRVLG